MEEKILSEEFHMTLQSTSAYHFLFNLFSDAFIKDLGAEILCSLENSVKKKKKLLRDIYSIMHVEEEVWGKAWTPVFQQQQNST